MIKFKHNNREHFYNLAYETLSAVADELKRELEKRRTNEVHNDTINKLENYDHTATLLNNMKNYYYYASLRQNNF